MMQLQQFSNSDELNQDFAKRFAKGSAAGTQELIRPPETEIFERPQSKDIGTQMVVDLRRMLRNAGFDDGAIVEIMAHVALNLFTNYINVALDVPVDFPKVALLRAA